MVGVGNSSKIANGLEYCSIMVQGPMILKAIRVLNKIQSYLSPAVRRQFLMIQLKDRAKRKDNIWYYLCLQMEPLSQWWILRRMMTFRKL